MKRSSLIFIAILILSGCTNVTSPPPQSNLSTIMPLAIGNMWVERTTYDSANVAKTRIDSIRIIDTVTYRGELHYISQITPREYSDTNNIVLYVNRQDGLRILNIPKGEVNFLRQGYNVVNFTFFAARYPGRVGEALDTSALTNESSPDPIGKAITVIGSTSESVTVPAGTFNCYRYDQVAHYDSLPNLSYPLGASYYAPGIGLIKEPGTELISYTIR